MVCENIRASERNRLRFKDVGSRVKVLGFGI